MRKLTFRNNLKTIYNEAKKQRMPLINRIENVCKQLQQGA